MQSARSFSPPARRSPIVTRVNTNQQQFKRVPVGAQFTVCATGERYRKLKGDRALRLNHNGRGQTHDMRGVALSRSTLVVLSS